MLSGIIVSGCAGAGDNAGAGMEVVVGEATGAGVGVVDGARIGSIDCMVEDEAQGLIGFD